VRPVINLRDATRRGAIRSIDPDFAAFMLAEMITGSLRRRLLRFAASPLEADAEALRCRDALNRPAPKLTRARPLSGDFDQHRPRHSKRKYPRSCHLGDAGFASTPFESHKALGPEG
jgi:hypothetical protein